MPSTKLKFLPPNRNLDASTPSENCYLIQDGELDKAGAFHRRPGRKLLNDLSLVYPELANFGGLGQYWWQIHGIDIIVVNGRVFKLIDRFGNTSSVVELTGASLGTSRRVTFAECYDVTTAQTLLFMANGGNLIYTDGNTLFTAAGAGLPTSVSHVISIDTYLAVNDLTKPTEWFANAPHAGVGGPGYPTDWTASFSYSAKSINDNIKLLELYQDKVMLVGSRTTEFWQDTGDASPFAVVLGATNHFGTMNPYSISRLDNDVVYFTNTRDIVAMNGFTPQVISETYAKELHALSVVADASSEFISSIGGKKYFLLSFPDSGRTIAFNIETMSFSEWGTLDSEGDQGIFTGTCYTYSNDWGMHLILDRTKPYVYSMSPDYYKDDTQTMKTQMITGWYDHGTGQRKRSNRLLINVRRGATTLVETETFEISEIRPAYGIGEQTISTMFDVGALYVVVDPGISASLVGVVPLFVNFNTSIPAYNGYHTCASITSTDLLFGSMGFQGVATGTITEAPTRIITTLPHGLVTGDIINVSGTATADGGYEVTVLDDTTFTILAILVPGDSATIVITKDTEYSPKLYLAFRDDGNQAWGNDIELDLGTLGNTETPIVLQGMGGVYRQRQYRFTFGDNTVLSINSMEEEVELLG